MIVGYIFQVYFLPSCIPRGPLRPHLEIRAAERPPKNSRRVIRSVARINNPQWPSLVINGARAPAVSVVHFHNQAPWRVLPSLAAFQPVVPWFPSVYVVFASACFSFARRALRICVWRLRCNATWVAPSRAAEFALGHVIGRHVTLFEGSHSSSVSQFVAICLPLLSPLRLRILLSFSDVESAFWRTWAFPCASFCLVP